MHHNDNIDSKNTLIKYNIQFFMFCVTERFSNTKYEANELVLIEIIELIKGENEMNYNDGFVDSNLPAPLTRDQICEYFKKYQLGDESAKDIISHNIRLVIYQAKKFINTDYDMEDLVSIGIMGLIKSIDTFDLSKNIKFITYASRCINNEILMFLRKNKKHLSVKSLEAPITTDYDGNELKIEDVLKDDNLDFVSDYENTETSAIIRRIVEELPNREKEIIMLHFGFYDDKIYTQKQIAEKLNISQSYISRLISKIVKSIGKKLLDEDVIDVVGKRENKEEKKMPKKLQSLYEYFKNYSKEEINLMITKLSDDEKDLIKLRYGKDLENPVTSEDWGEEQRKKFYGLLVPKMRRLLSNPVEKRKKCTNLEEKVVESSSIAKDDKTTIKQPEMLKKEEKNIPNEAYIKILETMKTLNFGEMLNVLSPKEAIIICLRLGYVDGKYFTTESIAGFLGVEEEEVREITKKILLVYKENINNFIDQAINIVTDNPVLKY